MKKTILFLLVFITIIAFVSAQECQYTTEVVNSTETNFLPYDLNGNQLEEVTVEFNDLWNQPAKIINPNSKDISIILKLNLNVKSKAWCNPPSQQMDYVITKEVTIPANSFLEIPIEKPMKNRYCDEFKWNNIVEIQYQENDDVKVKLTTIENKVLVCDGKDDGSSCNSPNECGGGFCIEGYCSNTELCFNNECHCSNDEIQCTNNKQCVQKQIVPLDVKPKCDLNEECVSGYISLESGLCAKSPAQINEENEQKKRLYLFLGIGLIILLVIGMFVYYKIKKINLERIEKEIKQLSLSERDRKASKKILEELKEDKTSYDKFCAPRKSRYLGMNVYEWLNPNLNFYPCYVNNNIKTNKLIHRDIAEKKIYNKNKSFYDKKYGIPFNKLEVHHIDHNKFNYKLSNLIILSKLEHNKIINDNINDWSSGIKELKRIGLSNKEFPHEVTKRLRNQ